MTQLIPLIIRYWPVIKVILELIRNNRDLLDGLVLRPETCVEQDCRDFLDRAEWTPFEPKD